MCTKKDLSILKKEKITFATIGAAPHPPPRPSTPSLTSTPFLFCKKYMRKDCPHFKKRTKGTKLKVEKFTVYYKTKKVKLKNKAVQKDYKK